MPRTAGDEGAAASAAVAAPAGAVVLHVECAGFPRRVVVQARGAPGGVWAVAPLVRFLRRQRTWPGAGWVEIAIAAPGAVAHAWTTPGAITRHDALAARAGFAWFFPVDWRAGVLHLFAWRGDVEMRLSEELRRRAAWRRQRS